MKYKNFIQRCDWEITTKCNLNCKHCLINYKPKKELSTKECFLVIDLLKKLGCKQINFTGGEALIKKNFLKILKYSYERGIVNNLFTNGTQINSKNIIFLKKYINYIGVSIEGMKEENDFIRGKNSYNKVKRTLVLLNKEKIPFGIYMTLNKKNILNLKKILKKIVKYNPKNISLNELVFRGKAKKNKKKVYVKINNKEILRILKEIFPDERFRIERGCNINPKNIFLTSEGKFYFCTEIRQCKKTKFLGSFFPPNFHKFKKFSNNFSKKNLPKNCPYFSYISKNIKLNLLTGKKCPFIK
ncbi:MAG: radical SAM protein [Candidatus Pacearchaeota archaeon]